jgi:chromosomal replication initiation ATPase DnaA
MSKASFQAWFSQTVLLSLKDGEALIGAPTERAKEWIENRLKKVVERSMASLGYKVEMQVQVM